MPRWTRRSGEGEEPAPPGPPSLKGRGEKDLPDSIAFRESGEAKRAFTPFPSGRGVGGLGPLSKSSRIHFPRRRSPSNRFPVTSAFHAGFHGRRSFRLLWR